MNHDNTYPPIRNSVLKREKNIERDPINEWTVNKPRESCSVWVGDREACRRKNVQIKYFLLQIRVIVLLMKIYYSEDVFKIRWISFRNDKIMATYRFLDMTNWLKVDRDIIWWICSWFTKGKQKLVQSSVNYSNVWWITSIATYRSRLVFSILPIFQPVVISNSF